MEPVSPTLGVFEEYQLVFEITVPDCVVLHIKKKV